MNEEVEKCTRCQQTLHFNETSEDSLCCNGDACCNRYREQCAADIYFGSTWSTFSAEKRLDLFRSLDNQRRLYPFLCSSCDCMGTTRHLITYFQSIKRFQIAKANEIANDRKLLDEFIYEMFIDLGCAKSETDRSILKSESEVKAACRKDKKFLIGKAVQIFCPIDGIYHFGHVIDSKNEDLTTCLVRFPAGMNGRNTAFHQWINVDIHSIKIGCSSVWVEKLKDEDDQQQLVKFRWPGQIILCTNLEILLNNKEKSSQTRVALFGTFDEEICHQNDLKRFPSAFNEEELAIFQASPINLDLSKAVIAAYAENEEQLRIKSWDAAYGSSFKTSDGSFSRIKFVAEDFLRESRRIGSQNQDFP